MIIRLVNGMKEGFGMVLVFLIFTEYTIWPLELIQNKASVSKIT